MNKYEVDVDAKQKELDLLITSKAKDLERLQDLTKLVRLSFLENISTIASVASNSHCIALVCFSTESTSRWLLRTESRKKRRVARPNRKQKNSSRPFA